MIIQTSEKTEKMTAKKPRNLLDDELRECLCSYMKFYFIFLHGSVILSLTLIIFAGMPTTIE